MDKACRAAKRRGKEILFPLDEWVCALPSVRKRRDNGGKGDAAGGMEDRRRKERMESRRARGKERERKGRNAAMMKGRRRKERMGSRKVRRKKEKGKGGKQERRKDRKRKESMESRGKE